MYLNSSKYPFDEFDFLALPNRLSEAADKFLMNLIDLLIIFFLQMNGFVRKGIPSTFQSGSENRLEHMTASRCQSRN